MVEQLKSYVEGRWVAGTGRTAALFNPTTEEKLAECSTEGLDFGAALAYARTTGAPALHAMTFAERGERLAAASKAIHEHREDLVALAIANGGNTRGDAKFDIDGGTGTLMYYAKLAQKLGDRRFLRDGELEQLTRAPRYVGRHIQTPIPGVALHINAFNFPAWGMLEKAGVALAAGVPVVTKPGTSTALVAYRVMQILIDADVLPAGALSMITGSAGDVLDHLQLGDAVAFTGSSGVGQIVRERTLGRARVNVEADSLNAVVVGPDVDEDSDTYELFLRQTAVEITQKAGQKCTATRRIFVPADRFEAVAADLGERVGEVRIGNPNLREVRMGPVATKRQFDDVRAGIDRLASACTFVHGDGGRGSLVDVPEGKGYFIAPTLLSAPDYQCEVVHAHEVFGPVSTLLPYSGDPAEAVDGVARGQGGLVASIYTDDKDFAGEVVMGAAPWSGRITIGSRRVAEHALGPGMVLPQLVHGGPGRAGGGEELGGLRGLAFYTQRTAVQGSKPLLAKLFGSDEG